MNAATSRTRTRRVQQNSTAFSRFMANPFGAISAAVLLLVVIACFSAPLLPLSDPSFVVLRDALQPPSEAHLLGTDTAGRDILSRLLWGGQVNLLGALLAAGVALAVGLPTGLLAGYYGGWFDGVSNWFNNMNMALPGIVVVLAVRAVVGPSVWVAMAVFGVMMAPAVYRIVRAAVQSVRGELYVDAARVSGLSDVRIIGRHVLRVVRAPIIIQTARMASIAIAIQAGLEFLGVSDNTVPSWGNMLNEAFRRIGVSPQLVVWPSVAIALVCVALVLLGNALRDALEDRGTSSSAGHASPADTVAIAVDGMPVDSLVETGAVSTSLPETPRSEEPSGADAVAPTTLAPDTSDALLTVRGLRVAYGSAEQPIEVVHGVDLHIAPAEVLGLVGESGSGKSQTAFSILSLLPAGGRVAAGSITFDGVELTSLAEREMRQVRAKDIAYIPQEPMSNLDPSFRIGHQLTAPLRHAQGMTKKEATQRSLELLERVGIPDPKKTFDSYPHEISGGMAQRVLIAGAVAARPKLLIADEPTTALDVTVQAEVLDLLRDLQQETGMAVLLVTHNFGVVADLCNRVAVMRQGRIVETGGVEHILGTPSHPYTRKLIASTLEGGPARPYPFDAASTGPEGGIR